jgi:hypothetical protein
VFYELALRHALRKPFIQLIETGESIPFDVGSVRTVFLDHHDMDSVEVCKAEIQAHIHAIEESPQTPVETPVSVSIDLQQLRRSDNPLEKSSAEILEALPPSTHLCQVGWQN